MFRAYVLSVLSFAGPALSVAGQVPSTVDAAAANASAGWAAFENGRLEEAKSMLSQAVQQEPKQPDYEAALGLVEREMGDLSAAIHHLRAATQLEPTNTEYRLRLAGAYQAADQDLKALKVLKLTRVDPVYVNDWRFTRGFSLFRVGKLSAARSEFTSVVGNPQFTGPANFFLGNIAFSENDFKDAARFYSTAVHSDLDRDKVAFNAYLYDYGLALFRLGRFADAKAQFQASVERYDHDPLPWMYLGRCEQELGNYQASIEMMEKSIAVDPKFQLAYYELARLQKRYGDPQRAEQLFASITSMKQDEVAAEERRAEMLKMGATRH